MKKLFLFILIISFVTSVIPTSLTLSASDASGEKLKGMGLLKGFADGTLREEKLITNGECLTLIARLVNKMKTFDISDLVAPKNKFDNFINNIHRGYVSLKNKIIDSYYNLLALLPNYEVIPGVNKSHWFYKSSLYLKRIGFKFSDNLDVYAKATEADVYSWLFEALGYGDSTSAVQGADSLTESQKLQILMVEHGLPYEDFSPRSYVKRARVFDLALDVLNK